MIRLLNNPSTSHIFTATQYALCAVRPFSAAPKMPDCMGDTKPQYPKLFEDRAADYAKFRVTYPDKLFEEVYSATQLKSFDLAVDVATGSGQAAVKLAERFAKVVAIDPNERMIAEAPAIDGVEYHIGHAEQLDLPDNSADLVTVAQALHWFDIRQFYSEVVRVVKPNGAFAAWCYGLSNFQDNTQADAAVHSLYEKLGPFWSERRVHVENKYQDLVPVAEEFAEWGFRTVEINKEVEFGDFLGYLSTWSAYNTFRKAHPNTDDPLKECETECMAALGLESRQEVVKVCWPVQVLFARGPRKDS